MDLIRDLLDKKVVDRHGRDLGRVDRIVLQMRPQTPPRVVAIEVGPVAAGLRIGRVFGRLAAALEHVFGVGDRGTLRIPEQAILEARDHVKVDLTFADTSASALEQRLRRLISSIPGSS
jgi:sporulation protein YlmC with PRC-barrel domain